MENLQQRRRKLGLSLEDVSARTKVRVEFLRAIEEGRMDELPAGVYRRSYIRQYAEALGMDASALLNEAKPSASLWPDDRALLVEMARARQRA
ncbi:MAG: helix-turn-helix domain-containing protein [Bryobacteraceae bacterium]|nr:helix-turn-helix domain-containing protein [Bryobacteraceae bacterium]